MVQNRNVLVTENREQQSAKSFKLHVLQTQTAEKKED